MSLPSYKFALREDLKNDKQFLPTRAEPKATGWDVRAAIKDRTEMVIKPFQHVQIPLGFRAFCPEGWWYQLKPRSSTFGKKSLHSLYGTIDETYEGELVFAAQYIPSARYFDWAFASTPHGTSYPGVNKWEDYCLKNSLNIKFGDAIGQIVPTERQEMETVEASNEEIDALYKERNSVRKDGGFGSTDSK